MSLAALLGSSLDGLVVRLGDSDAPGNADVTNPVAAVVTSSAIAEDIGDVLVTVEYELPASSGNGTVLREVALYVDDGATVIGRELLASPVEKTALVVLRGQFAQRFSLTPCEAP